MSNPSQFDGSWDRVSAELRACKEAQRKAYGDVDSATLGRYLAGEMTAEEKATLEESLAELPELRKLTDLVQGVLSDLEPIADFPADPLPSPAPVLLSMPAPRPRRNPSPLRRYAPFAAAACLLVVLGALMPRPGFLSVPREGHVFLTGGSAERGTGSAAAGVETRMVFLQPPERFRDGLGGINPVALNAPPALAPKGSSGGRAGGSPAPIDKTVAFFHAQGEVARAEKTLRKEYDVCRKELGPDDRKTKWAGRQLAGVYQYALNNAEDGSLIHKPATPGGSSPAPAQHRATNTARLVRDQIANQRTTQVKATVVPILTEALGEAESLEERLALTAALGKLGPAARPAVPLLCKRLQDTNEPREREAILTTLERMGPVAKEAAATLALLVGKPEDKKAIPRLDEKDQRSLSKGSDASKGDSAKRLSPAEEKRIFQLLARLTGRESHVGVFDAAGLFCLKSNMDATRTLRQLARTSLLEVRVETLPPNSKAPASVRPKPWAIQVVFVSGGRSVSVAVGQSVRDRGLDTDRLSRQLVECCRNGENDSALSKVIEAAKAIETVEKQ